jgi:deoxyribose-phosphate aldolase
VRDAKYLLLKMPEYITKINDKMNATVFRITENGYITDKMTVKACKISKQIMVQLLQTGTDEKPSSKTVSQVLLIFYNSINDKNNV